MNKASFTFFTFNSSSPAKQTHYQLLSSLLDKEELLSLMKLSLKLSGGGGDAAGSANASRSRFRALVGCSRTGIGCIAGLAVGYLLGGQRKSLLISLPSGTNAPKSKSSGGSSSTPPGPSVSWWEPVVQSNQAKPIGFRVYETPVPFEQKANDLRLLQLLNYLSLEDPSIDPIASPGATVIDIGLPTESMTYAKAGYQVQAFEARQQGYDLVMGFLNQLNATERGRVHLHRTALSNYTGTTDIFDANDSASLLKGAVVNGGVEEQKFIRHGGRMETVPVTTLDQHFRSLASPSSVVGMKVDTQGVEPEIFMGAQSLLGNPAAQPRAIAMEYCTRFRPFEESSVGVHLLIGLGYTCYYEQGTNHGASLVITAETYFEGDLYCTNVPLRATTASN
jgi:FkbM family methyltransferase